MSSTSVSRALEHEFILSGVASAFDEAARAQFRRLGQGHLNWNYVLETADLHGVLPLLRARIEEFCSGHLPSPVVRQINCACLANTARNLALTGELLRILAAFESEGIEAVPFKGPVLAEQIFGTVAMRQFCDIDILVKPESVIRARNILAARGYVPEFGLSAAREAEYMRAEHAFQLRRAEGDVVVELHWSLGSKNQAFPLAAETVWQNLVTNHFQGTSIRALCREDLFIYLAMHGAKHGWERLEWICSLACLVASSPLLDWDLIVETATRRGALRGVHLALILTTDTCGLPLPSAVAQSAIADEGARQLACQLKSRLFDPQPNHCTREFQRHAYYLRSRERLADRVRIVWYSCARIPHPLARDWDLFRLPSRMSFLYYFLRPLRLFRDYGLRILQG